MISADTTLQAEVLRQRAQRAGQGDWAQPALPFLRIYPRGEGLPADLARQYAANPRRHEVAGDDGRHYHLRRLDADGTVLVAEVSTQLVVRPLRNTLLLWLVATGSSLTLLAAEGKRQVLLRRDVEELRSSGKSLMPDGLEKDVTPQEVADLLKFLMGSGK